MTKQWLAILPLLLLSYEVRAEGLTDAVKKFEARIEPADAKPGQTVTLKIELALNDGWYTYATNQPDEEAKGSATKILLPKSSDLIFVEPVRDPAGFQSSAEPMLNIKEQRYYLNGTTWEIKAVVSPKATAGRKQITVPRVQVVVCMKFPKQFCLPAERRVLTADLNVLDGPAVPVDPKYQEEVDRALSSPPPLVKDPPILGKKDDAPKTNIGPEDEKKDVPLRIARDRDYAADMEAVRKMLPADSKSQFGGSQAGNAGFIGFLLTAMLWGVITLLTPCVFPMIPITVSFFLKQGEKKQHNPLLMAIVYTLTIVAVLGVAAMFFLATFRELAVNPWMNVALGLLFVFFALSLFGMYDITLPRFLVRFTSAREGKSGYGGVIFMALSFSIVSFTCVAPFLGGFAGMAASGEFSKLQLAAGALAFAGAFAAPFFLLALFPSLLKKLPKSGSWMNTIKVTMGFLELAAALKFLRTAELSWSIPTTLFTYDFVLSLWVVILVLAGLYLLNFYRLPHDEPQEHIGVSRLLCGLFSIGIGIYLIPGLFSAGHEKQRPSGTIYAWVDAFLLPDPGAELGWASDLRGTIEQARESGETVFVDLTGVTCTNCKLNEKNVFPQAAVYDLLKKYRRVQLYTDWIPPGLYESPPDEDRRWLDARANLNFESDVFGTKQLPLYVLLKPEPGARGGPVKILGVYDEGKINKVDAFKSFLRQSLPK